MKLNHLVTFGCPTYVHITSHRRRKLEDKAFEGVMVGYSTDSPSYIIYNKQTRRTVVTKHVRSDEIFKGRQLDKGVRKSSAHVADREAKAPEEEDSSSDDDNRGTTKGSPANKAEGGETLVPDAGLPDNGMQGTAEGAAGAARDLPRH